MMIGTKYKIDSEYPQSVSNFDIIKNTDLGIQSFSKIVQSF